MGRRKSQRGYKIKQKPKRPSAGVCTSPAADLNKTQKSRRNKRRKKANKALVAKVEKGLSEICSGLNGIEFDAKPSKIPSDLSYNKTETFLRQNGIDAFSKRRNSKKRTNRIYSMVQMIQSLPKPSKEHEHFSIVKPAKLDISQRKSSLRSQLIQPAKLNVESSLKADKKLQQQERMLARKNKTAFLSSNVS